MEYYQTLAKLPGKKYTYFTTRRWFDKLHEAMAYSSKHGLEILVVPNEIASSTSDLFLLIKREADVRNGITGCCFVKKIAGLYHLIAMDYLDNRSSLVPYLENLGVNVRDLEELRFRLKASRAIPSIVIPPEALSLGEWNDKI
jgi:hypothetical protein